MSEWLKELPWKGSIRVTVSRVRISSSLQNDPELKTLGIFLWTKLKVYFRAKGHEKYQLIEERKKGCVLSYSQKRVHVIISSSLQNDPKLKMLGIFLWTRTDKSRPVPTLLFLYGHLSTHILCKLMNNFYLRVTIFQQKHQFR